MTTSSSVQNMMEPIDRPEESQETVHVYARNSFGNMIIRHATAPHRTR